MGQPFSVFLTNQLSLPGSVKTEKGWPIFTSKAWYYKFTTFVLKMHKNIKYKMVL